MSATNPAGAEQIRGEIEATRADLADTVDALSAKLDVKAQAKSKATELRATAADVVAKAKQSAPPPVQESLDRAGAALAPAAAKAKTYRTQILAAAAVGVVITVVVRRTRRTR